MGDSRPRLSAGRRFDASGEVGDLLDGRVVRRIYEYCFPLEDRRARAAYGVPSGVNNILIINRAVATGRITAILVRESSGSDSEASE